MLIIKIGGGSGINIQGVVDDLKDIDDKLIIVHGANASRDEIAEKMGKPKKTVTSASGYSSVLSDDDAIDMIMMSYSGIVNKRLVELCQVNGINAVGLSGLDGKLIQGRRNRGIKTKKDGKLMLLRDNSGKPKSVNTQLLRLLLDSDYVPVLCIPIVDEEGYAINTENDSIVNVLQQAMKADKIIQLIEAPGFLDDKDDENSLVKEISKLELESREEQVEGRMKRKMLALKQLFQDGAAEVIISDGRVENPVKNALAGKGTIIK